MSVYIDGTKVPPGRAVVSVYDHGLLYGDGVFEGLRIYGGSIYRLEAHVERLFNSARAVALDMPTAQSELCDQLRRFVAEEGRSKGYIRLVVTRGRGSLGLDPASCTGPTVIVIIDDIQLYPAELYREGIPVVTAATRRAAGDVLDPRVKSLNYLNNILAKLEARNAGCPEAVMLNRDGYVTECTADNIFVVHRGTVRTPPAYLGILEGITRDTVIGLAAEIGAGCREDVLTRYDLYCADECFLTGSGAEVMPVTAVDGRRVGDGRPGPITARIREAFSREVAAAAAAAAAAGGAVR